MILKAFFYLLLTAVTFPVMGADKSVGTMPSLNGLESLFGETPTHKNVERFLIDGFHREAVTKPRVRYADWGYDIYPIEEADIDHLFSKFYLKLGNYRSDPFYSYSKNTTPDIADLPELAADRLKLGSHTDFDIKFYESLIWLRDSFDTLWSEQLKKDPFILDMHARINSVINQILDPPKLNPDDAPLSQRELEQRANENAVKRVYSELKFDPRSAPDRQTVLPQLGLQEIDHLLRSLGNNTKVFKEIYGFDPDHASSGDIDRMGRKRFERGQNTFINALNEERILLENQVRRKTRDSEKGEEIKIDRIQQIRGLKEQLLKQFMKTIGARRYQAYKIEAEGSSAPYDYTPAEDSDWKISSSERYSLIQPVHPDGKVSYDVLLSTDRILDEAILKGTSEGKDEPRHTADGRLAFAKRTYFTELAKKQSILEFLRHSQDFGFMSYHHDNYYDFIFQKNNVHAQAYGALFSILERLEQSYSSLQFYNNYPSSQFKEKQFLEEIAKLKTRSEDLQKSAYANWFQSIFRTKRKYSNNYNEHGFSNMELFRIIAVWGLMQNRDYYKNRDLQAVATGREDVVAEYLKRLEFNNTEKRWQETIDRYRYPELYKRPEESKGPGLLSSFGLGPRSGDKGDASADHGTAVGGAEKQSHEKARASGNGNGNRNYLPLNLTLGKIDTDIETKGNDGTGAEEEKSPAIVTVDRWDKTATTTLFTTTRPGELIPAEIPVKPGFNPARDLRVTVLEPQPIQSGKLILLTPQDSSLLTLQIYDEANQLIDPATYKIKKSTWDGGVVIVFNGEKELPPALRYRAMYRHTPGEEPNIRIGFQHIQPVMNRIKEANASVLADDLAGTKDILASGITLQNLVRTFSKLSYYVKSLDFAEALKIESAIPASYSQLVTKDGYFVGNCSMGNEFVSAITTPAFANSSTHIETRIVLMIEGREFARGEPLHKNIFAVDSNGKKGWLDATPVRTGMNNLKELPNQKTRAELLNESLPIVEKVENWFLSLGNWFRSKANPGEQLTLAKPTVAPAPVAAVQEVAKAKTVETDIVKPAENISAGPALQIEIPTLEDLIQRAWKKILDPNSETYHELQSQLAHLETQRSVFLVKAKAAGMATLKDQTHPIWTTSFFAGMFMSYAKGERSFENLTADYARTFGVVLDRDFETPADYLEKLKQKLNGIEAITLKQLDRPELKSADKNLLLLAQALQADTQKALRAPGLEAWHSIGGILKTCDSLLKK